jgi:pyruvate dehydrogenase (quinone)
MVRTVADQFAEMLAAAGATRIYGIVGNSLDALTDAASRPRWKPSRPVKAMRSPTSPERICGVRGKFS